MTKPLGHRLVLHATDALAEDEPDVLRGLADRTSDGLILCPIRVTTSTWRRWPPSQGRWW